jgi:hypothetical protein
MENKSCGVGFTSFLTLLFIGLKLCGVIGWSWWWVLSPLWISFLIGMGIFFFAVLMLVLLKGK